MHVARAVPVNTDTVAPPTVAPLAVPKSRPERLNATEFGALPVWNGEPESGVNWPALLTANTDTSLS